MRLVISKDLRPALGPVRDQGRRATCLAFAASAVHGLLQGYDGQLCVEWLFYHAVTRAGDDPADGSTIEDTEAVLRELGQPDDAFWPYEAAQPDLLPGGRRAALPLCSAVAPPIVAAPPQRFGRRSSPGSRSCWACS
jgi:hypothetical protein